MAYRQTFINPEDYRRANIGEGERLAQSVFQPQANAADQALSNLTQAGRQPRTGNRQGSLDQARGAADRLLNASTQNSQQALASRYGRQGVGGSALNSMFLGEGNDSPYARAAAAAASRASSLYGAAGQAQAGFGEYDARMAAAAKQEADSKAKSERARRLYNAGRDLDALRLRAEQASRDVNAGGYDVYGVKGRNAQLQAQKVQEAADALLAEGYTPEELPVSIQMFLGIGAGAQEQTPYQRGSGWTL